MNVECMVILFDLSWGKKKINIENNWYSILPYILHKTRKFFHFCQISGISGTSGSPTPMGEHPWVTET